MELPSDAPVDERTRNGWSRSVIRDVVTFKERMSFTILRNKDFWDDCLTGYTWHTLFNAFKSYINIQAPKFIDNVNIVARSWQKIDPCEMIRSCTVRINSLFLYFAEDDPDGLCATVSSVVRPVPNLLVYSPTDNFRCGKESHGGFDYYKDYNSTSDPVDLIAPPESPAPPGTVMYIHITKPGGTLAPHWRYSNVKSRTTINGFRTDIPSWLAGPIVATLTRKDLSQRFIYPPQLVRSVPPKYVWISRIVSAATMGILLTATTPEHLQTESTKYKYPPKVSVNNKYIVSESVHTQLSLQMDDKELDMYFELPESV